jgi:hypothetical protein
MQMLNRMIRGARNWVNGDTLENPVNEMSIRINHHIKPPSSQVCYKSREEAIEAAKAEIDARIK